MASSKTLLALLGGIALALPAAADTVTLTNGGKLEGEARRSGDEVIVRTGNGEVTLRADEVAFIEESAGATPPATVPKRDAYADRARAVAQDDADAQTDLGDWCHDHGMPREAKRHWERALAANPDHADARSRLGFIRYEDRWLTEDEYREARGFVKVGGRWLSRAEARRRDSAERLSEEMKAHKKKIDDCVRRMSSMKRKERLAAKVELQEYAESREDLRLASFASEVAGYYNRAWASVRRSLVKTEVRATHTQLKRPIPEIQTSLGAGSTPVRIQLPELSVVQVRTTVLIPADIELDEDP